MSQYLQCLKLVKGNNAPNCRILAKRYLGCRMDNQLMDRDDWKNLGLPEDEKSAASSNIISKDEKKFGEPKS